MSPASAPSLLPAPAERNRVVDLVRVTAISGVVIGHWLKQGWHVDAGGELHRTGLLAIATWTHPLTWVFQVMPLFFLVGGYVKRCRGATPVSGTPATAPGSRAASGG